MAALKRYFVLPFFLFCCLASVHVAWGLLRSPSLAWAGAALVLWPFVGFFIALARTRQGRTPRNLPWQFFASTTGALLALFAVDTPATVYAVVGWLGVMLYIKWYSILDRPPSALVEGAPLPPFELEAADGARLSSAGLAGKPTLFLFARGNWCPLCVAQVGEVADIYQYVAEKGARVVVVSPQDLAHTRELAARFNSPLQFCSDPGGAAARALGIEHRGGVPFGLPGYGKDTVFPTIVLTDADNRVIFVDETRNYRVRPAPEALLEVVETQL